MVNTKAYARFRPAAAVAAAWVVLGAALGGCAGLGDGPLSSAFVNPAAYDFYDCKQLADERRGLAKQTEKWQQLIDKANTGVAGPVVAELAYREDYIATRASAKQAEEAWRQNKCTEASVPAADVPVVTGPARRPPGGARAPVRSGDTIR